VNHRSIIIAAILALLCAPAVLRKGGRSLPAQTVSATASVRTPRRKIAGFGDSSRRSPDGISMDMTWSTFSSRSARRERGRFVSAPITSELSLGRRGSRRLRRESVFHASNRPVRPRAGDHVPLVPSTCGVRCRGPDDPRSS